MEQGKIDQIINHLKDEFSSLRTGRATPLLVEKILVDAYGSKMPINQLATINTPEPLSLSIQPFDQSNIKAIEEAIQKSDLGLNPVNEGKLLRIVIPAMTEERRTELNKLIKEKTELARVAIRKLRDESIKIIRQDEKSGSITEDDKFTFEKDLQKTVDENIKDINDLLADKEKEILSV
ncbi:ribosome recycling factor [Patescibacteria group bacterium]